MNIRNDVQVLCYKTYTALFDDTVYRFVSVVQSMQATLNSIDRKTVKPEVSRNAVTQFAIQC